MYTRLYKHTHTQTLTSTRFVLALEYIAYTSRIPWDDGWTRQCSNTAHFELNAATEKSFRKGLMPDGEIWPTHMCQPAYCWIESQENSSKTFLNFHVAVGPEEISFWAMSMKSSWKNSPSTMAVWVFRKWLRAVSPDVCIRVFIFVCSGAGSTCLLLEEAATRVASAKRQFLRHWHKSKMPAILAIWLSRYLSAFLYIICGYMLSSLFDSAR